jgi:urease accessory protein
MESKMRLVLICFVLIAAFVTPASAHPSMMSAMSFAAGVAHPLSGLDHIAAMVAVGLWAAAQGNRALWVWPLTFVAVMLIGGAMGLAQIALPFVEPGILASVIVLGLMVALAVDLPLWGGAALISVFALLHGHAHGTEVAHNLNGLEYVAGFALATGLLHAVGIGAGLTLQRVALGRFSRVAGAVCVAIGAALWTGVA